MWDWQSRGTELMAAAFLELENTGGTGGSTEAGEEGTREGGDMNDMSS